MEQLDILTSLRESEGSRASRSPQQVKDEGQRTLVGSGQKCLELSSSLDQNGSLQRMLEVLLTGEAEWHSTKCLLTWKPKVTAAGRNTNHGGY